MLRHAARVNGFTGLAVNHLDTLAGLEVVKVGHAYDLDGGELLTMPSTTERWGECEAVFREFEGWPETDWTDVVAEGYEAIPENARAYLEYLETELEAPVYAVGVGPAREETVVVRSPWE
jgi:adenylosuccinate synthase